VAEDLENADLAGDPFDVGLLDDLLLLQRLDGYPLPRVHVHPYSHLPERPLPDALP
jgi:hypothetical protein